MKIINTNPGFGYEGPYEAESFEALADEMTPTLTDWAKELISDRGESCDQETLEETVEELRDKFIEGLEIID